MAVAAGTAGSRGGSLSRFFMGPRIGATMTVLGLVLATAAAVLVLSLGRRSHPAAAETPAPAAQVGVAYVVVAARDLPDNTRVTADAVVVKPFPEAYLPAGAASAPEQVVGKYTATHFVRDQIVLTSQVATNRRGANLGAAVPPGKVAVWIPMPDLLSQTGGLRPGDRVDIQLSLTLPPAAGTASGAAAAGPAPAATPVAATGIAAQTTQLTLQNVEIFYVGTAGAEAPPPPAPEAQTTIAGQSTAPQTAPPSQGAPSQSAPPGTRVAVVLLDPQDALVAKFIKDGGGNVDMTLRSRDWPDVVTTEPVTVESLVDRFGFRTRGGSR